MTFVDCSEIDVMEGEPGRIIVRLTQQKTAGAPPPSAFALLHPEEARAAAALLVAHADLIDAKAVALGFVRRRVYR